MTVGPAVPHGLPRGATRLGRRRLLAGAVDAVLMAALASYLCLLTFDAATGSIMNPLRTISFGWNLFTSFGDYRHVATNTTRSAWDKVVLYLQIALLTLVAVEFLHHFVGVWWKGRSVGKALFGLQVTTHRGPATIGSRRAARRAATITGTGTGLPALSLIALLHGRFAAALLCWGLWSVALSVTSSIIACGRRSPADRLAGTAVIRHPGLLRSAGRRSVDAGRATAAGAWNSVRDTGTGGALRYPARIADHSRTLPGAGQAAVTRGRGALRAAGEVARGAGTDERLRPVLSSAPAQALRKAGRSALGRRFSRPAAEPAPGPNQQAPEPGAAPESPRYPPPGMR